MTFFEKTHIFQNYVVEEQAKNRTRNVAALKSFWKVNRPKIKKYYCNGK